MTSIPASIRPASTCEKRGVTLAVSSSTRAVAKLIFMVLSENIVKIQVSSSFSSLNCHLGSISHLQPHPYDDGYVARIKRSPNSMEQEKKRQSDVNLMSSNGLTETQRAPKKMVYPGMPSEETRFSHSVRRGHVSLGINAITTALAEPPHVLPRGPTTWGQWCR